MGTSGSMSHGLVASTLQKKKKFQLRPPENAQITIIDSPDLTLTGSRNAHSALVLWSYISMYSYDEQVKMAVEAEETTRYAEIQQDLWVIHAPASLAVCFKRPNDSILRKLAVH